MKVTKDFPGFSLKAEIYKKFKHCRILLKALLSDKLTINIKIFNCFLPKIVNNSVTYFVRMTVGLRTKEMISPQDPH